jgi:predicted lipoprotein with Yx(FWY)xxD motif
MKRTATAATWSVAALLLSAALTGCSSTNKGAASSTTPSASASATVVSDTSGGGYGSSSPTASSSGKATVGTKSAGKLGTILVDAKGRTLYLFMADTKKNQSTCTGACATAWPPLLTNGSAKTTQQAKKNLLGTAKRSGGKTQVTYNGHPLYLYAGDSKPGQTNGQGLSAFGALWYVVSPAGKQITTAP